MMYHRGILSIRGGVPVEQFTRANKVIKDLVHKTRYNETLRSFGVTECELEFAVYESAAAKRPYGVYEAVDAPSGAIVTCIKCVLENIYDD